MANDSSVLKRIIKPRRGGLSPALAREILAMDFPAADHVRYEELSAKASEGDLNDSERAVLEEYLQVNGFLTVIKAKAKASLRGKRSDA